MYNFLVEYIQNIPQEREFKTKVCDKQYTLSCGNYDSTQNYTEEKFNIIKMLFIISPYSFRFVINCRALFPRNYNNRKNYVQVSSISFPLPY